MNATAAAYRIAAEYLSCNDEDTGAAVLTYEANRLDAERARKVMIGNRLADEVSDRQLLSDDALVALHDLAVTLIGGTLVDAEVVDEPDPDEWRVLEEVPIVVKVHDRTGRLWEHHHTAGWCFDGFPRERETWNDDAPFTRARFTPNPDKGEQ